MAWKQRESTQSAECFSYRRQETADIAWVTTVNGLDTWYYQNIYQKSSRFWQEGWHSIIKYPLPWLMRDEAADGIYEYKIIEIIIQISLLFFWLKLELEEDHENVAFVLLIQINKNQKLWNNDSCGICFFWFKLMKIERSYEITAHVVFVLLIQINESQKLWNNSSCCIRLSWFKLMKMIRDYKITAYVTSVVLVQINKSQRLQNNDAWGVCCLDSNW